MNTNTLCLRIFFVFSLLLLAAGIFFIYGARLITPIALAWLPTQTAEARYANPYVWMEARVKGRRRLYRSQIQFNGHTTTLMSTAAQRSGWKTEPWPNRPSDRTFESTTQLSTETIADVAMRKTNPARAVRPRSPHRIRRSGLPNCHDPAARACKIPTTPELCLNQYAVSLQSVHLTRA